MSDDLYVGLWLLGALVAWAILAAPLSVLIGRLLARQSQPTLADRLRAVQSEPVDAAAMARKAGQR